MHHGTENRYNRHSFVRFGGFSAAEQGDTPRASCRQLVFPAYKLQTIDLEDLFPIDPRW